MILAAILLICVGLGSVKLAPTNSNPLLRFYQASSLNSANECQNLLDLYKKCKLVTDENQDCDDKNLKLMYASWEQNNYCRGMDYYDKMGSSLLKMSGCVFNITTNWTSFFDTRANSIIASPKGVFICQFAAKRWLQVRENTFFERVWKGNAVKCSNFIGNQRRGLMCAMCDKNQQSHFSFKNLTDSRTEKTFTNATVINFNFQTTQGFIENCLDYIENKQYILEKLNVEFTLGLCDKDGQYLAQGSDKSSYKKILPSTVIYDDDDIANCRLYLSRDLTMDAQQASKLEQSCTSLAERYFRPGALIFDDLMNYDFFVYMHDILKEIVSDNFHPNLFIQRDTSTSSLISLDFNPEVVFKFANSSVVDGLDIGKYTRESYYKEFDASKYVKRSLCATFSSLLLLLSIISYLMSK